MEDDDACKVIVLPGLRLVFRLVWGRWTHALEFALPDGSARAESDEWQPDATGADPVVRPVYQEVHLQPDRDAVLAFLVGQAGHHYFSASVRAYQQTATKSVVQFDIADRCRLPYEALEARYSFKPPVNALTPAQGHLLRWITRPERAAAVGIEPLAGLDPVSVVTAGTTADGIVQVRLATSSPARPGTNRVGYMWWYESPTGLDADGMIR